MSYTKLFQSIVTSSIWTQDDQTRIVWITMLALANQHGEVSASIPGLARVSGVTVEATQKAIASFLAPDEFSRTKAADGRRIEAIEGGWLVLNHAKYRAMATDDDRKQKAADRKARQREREELERHAMSRHVTPCHAEVTPESRQNPQAEAEAEAEAEAKSVSAHAPTVSRQCPDSVLLEERRGEEKRVERDVGEAHTPTWNEVKTLASMRAVPESSAKSFFDHHEGNCLWVNQYGRLINWQHKLASWAANDRANPKKGTENIGPTIPTFAEQLPPMTKEEREAHRKKMLAKAMECDKPKTRTEGEE